MHKRVRDVSNISNLPVNVEAVNLVIMRLAMLLQK